MDCIGAMGRLTLNGGIRTDRADCGVFASSAQAESPLKRLHSKSSRSIRRALQATGAAIGHSIDDVVPVLKRGRSDARWWWTIQDNDQLSNASTISRRHHISHHITYGKSDEDNGLKKRLDLVKQLREVTKEQMTKTEDPQALAELEQEDLALISEHRKILKKMISLTANEDF